MKSLSLNIVLVLITFSASLAQVNKDSILVNERTLDRPLNVHQGQLRVSGEYGFSYINKRFDAEGDDQKLKKDGIARAFHASYFNAKYGITEYLQFNALVGYQTQIIRTQQTFIFGFPSFDVGTLQSGTNKVAGIEEVALGLDFRVPFKTRKIDLLATAAILLPVGEHEQLKPTHKIKISDFGWEIEYQNETPVNRGVPLYRFGGAFKYRAGNIGITVIGDYTIASKETTQLNWLYQLNAQNEFEYSSTRYKTSPSDQLRANAIIEFQASPFANFYLAGSLLQLNNGWFEWNGATYKEDNKSLFTLGPGFELIITPRLWFRETFSLPLNGKSIDSGLQFTSTLSYNIFIN